MVKIFPFSGYLPARDKVEKVVSRPYDKYHADEVEKIVQENAFSFLNVIKPLLAKGIHVENPSDPATLRDSRLKFEQFAREGVFHQSESPCFYIYRQIKPDFVYTGIVATISSGDYRNNVIRIHEQTLAQREEKLRDYLKVVGINAEPVMFTYPHNSAIDGLMEKLTSAPPHFYFQADGKEHLLWQIISSEDIRKIEQAFLSIGHVYVADGHHRSASSVLLSEELALQYPDSAEDAPWKRFMGIFFPDHNMQLLAFHRLLKNTGGLSFGEVMERLQQTFYVDKRDEVDFNPSAPCEFSMFANNSWYALRFKVPPANANQFLDGELLNDYILRPVFGVQDIRKDSRIDFVPGPEGSKALRKKVEQGKAAIAFGLYPVSFEQFFEFSDKGKTMPPKSTWFEPKLLNGLVIYDLEIPGNEHS